MRLSLGYSILSSLSNDDDDICGDSDELSTKVLGVRERVPSAAVPEEEEEREVYVAKQSSRVEFKLQCSTVGPVLTATPCLDTCAWQIAAECVAGGAQNSVIRKRASQVPLSSLMSESDHTTILQRTSRSSEADAFGDRLCEGSEGESVTTGH